MHCMVEVFLGNPLACKREDDSPYLPNKLSLCLQLPDNQELVVIQGRYWTLVGSLKSSGDSKRH